MLLLNYVIRVIQRAILIYRHIIRIYFILDFVFVCAEVLTMMVVRCFLKVNKLIVSSSI